MNRMRWILLVLFSGLLGWWLVRYLVCQPNKMGLCVIVCLAALAGLVLVIVRLFQRRRIVPAGVALVVFAAAYLTSNVLFLSQEIDHPLPEITRSASDPGDGHTAVIYFTHGESPEYSPNAWIETMHHLDEDGVPFVPKLVRPMFFNSVRSEYLQAGVSLHNSIHQRAMDRLAGMMTAENDPELQFYLSFLDTDPRPDAALIEAMNEGASQVVLMPVFLTISSHTIEGIELLEQVDFTAYGVSLCIADPLWESENLKQMFVERVNANLSETPKDKVGIMLIGHGQPEEWDLLYPTQTEQENVFREEVRALLIDEGYLAENIVLSWMDFKSPEIAEGTQELTERGVEKLMVFPASISAESIHTDIEIPAAIKEAGVPAGVEVLNLGAWNDDRLVLEGVRENILACD